MPWMGSRMCSKQMAQRRGGLLNSFSTMASRSCKVYRCTQGGSRCNADQLGPKGSCKMGQKGQCRQECGCDLKVYRLISQQHGRRLVQRCYQGRGPGSQRCSWVAAVSALWAYQRHNGSPFPGKRPVAAGYSARDGTDRWGEGTRTGGRFQRA